MKRRAFVRHWSEDNVERAGEVRNVCLLVAIGVTADGCREILGIVEGPKEDKSGWSFARGFRGPTGATVPAHSCATLPTVGFQACS